MLTRPAYPAAAFTHSPAAWRVATLSRFHTLMSAIDRISAASARAAQATQPALMNGSVGLVLAPGGRLSRVLSITIAGGRIAHIAIIADPARLRALDLAVLEG